VGGLGVQPPSGLGRHLGQRLAEPGGHDGGHRPLRQRRVAQQDPVPPVLGQEVDRHLGRHDRAAEIHQHQHPVVGPHVLDGGHDQRGVGSQRVARLVEPTGGGDLHLVGAHAPGQLGHALGQRVTVRDDDHPDHGAERYPLPFCRPSVSLSDTSGRQNAEGGQVRP
jgi:hypothetical protein